jgi:oligoribonuclease NrnB/cAMP/cGMP phosphodiesterase (DHH superfamily)
MSTLDTWIVTKATNGITFVQRKFTRFTFMFDDDEAKALATLLNRKDREIARLKARIAQLTLDETAIPRQHHR